jgi:hypothetical protein
MGIRRKKRVKKGLRLPTGTGMCEPTHLSHPVMKRVEGGREGDSRRD